MSAAYRLTRLFSGLVVLMPFRLLYLFSDFSFFFIYYVIRYRRTVVRDNLKHAFPEKQKPELVTIEKKFYRHLCDLFIEVLKIPGLKADDLNKRVHFINPGIFKAYASKNQSLVAVTSHCSNWEWGGLALCGIAPEYKILGIYKPVKDNDFDTYLKDLRGRFGMELVPMKMTFRALLRQERLTITSLLSDQTPASGDAEFVMSFMGRQVPVHLGAEKIARKLNFPVIFLAMRKVSRGFYQVEAIPMEDQPATREEFEITRQHVQLLEKEIRKDPAFWLWSHRRWKHAGKSWPESVVVA
jgi:KDO2-lipid IV(A) lauroyltransferase